MNRFLAAASLLVLASIPAQAAMWQLSPIIQGNLTSTGIIYGQGQNVMSASSTMTTDGTNLTISTGAVNLTGILSATSWTTSGIRVVDSGTVNDSSSSGTVAREVESKIAPTVTATSATTFTEFDTVEIDAPTCSTNATCTGTAALYLSGKLNMNNNNITNIAAVIANNANGAQIVGGAASCTVPTFAPNRGTTTTGVGGGGTSLCLIVSGADEMDYASTTAGTWTIPSGAHVTLADATIKLTGVTTGTNQDVLCLSSASVVQLQAAASCTISDPALKTDKHVFTASLLSGLMNLHTWTYRLKGWEKDKDPNAADIELGLMAPDIAKNVPLCAMFYNDGKNHSLNRRHPKSYREECMIAALIKGMQEQQAEIAALQRARYLHL